MSELRIHFETFNEHVEQNENVIYADYNENGFTVLTREHIPEIPKFIPQIGVPIKQVISQ